MGSPLYPLSGDPMKTPTLFSMALVVSLSACSGQATHYVGDVTRTYSSPGDTDWVIHESGKGVTVFTSGTSLVVSGLSYGSLLFEQTMTVNEWTLDSTLSEYEQGEGTTASRAEYSPEYRTRMTFLGGRAVVSGGYVEIDATGTRLDEEAGASDTTQVKIKFTGTRW